MYVWYLLRKFNIFNKCFYILSFCPTEFVVIHNGIVTNYKDIKKFLESKGCIFESDTDTEIIAKLIKYLYDSHEDGKVNFRELVEAVIQQLVLHFIPTLYWCAVKMA